MKVTLLVVGKTTDKHIIALVDEYLSRLKHYLPTDIEVIPELRQTKALSAYSPATGWCFWTSMVWRGEA